MQKPKSSRKPFVEPALKEEASLEDVTLISGGISTRHGGGKPKGPSGHGSPRRSNITIRNSNTGHGRKH